MRLALARFPAREPVLIVSGDGLTDFDLAGFYRRMRAARAEAGLLVAAVADPRAYGVVELAGDGQVVGFVEKPAWLMEGAVVNTGIYYLEPGLLAGVPVGVPVDFGHELFPQWIAEGRRVRGEAGRGYWCDVGTVEQYRAAHEAALDGRVRLPWPVAVTVGPRGQGPVYLGPGAVVEPTAAVGPYAVIGAGVRVMPWARVERSIVGRAAVIGAHSQLKGAVVAEEARLDSYATVEENVVVGRRAHLGYSAHVFPGTRIGVGEAVAPGSQLYQHQGKANFRQTV
ncbi:putative Mannose-1-phosphate guanylyltransferase [Candidatus Hydrogenisulfobacillus filiaventi]|uniref:Putative Mannose-1-phosphate guanylyltransferase n=1 Tax=Candidatus Hydrogenisulfobacillus filiaventi TaxID=2707344 RepID=A0A6F8ZCB0_9FIRM|nr:putative Mannose-1-phosphate guanylyltransferase [Candidatus Hydrogenisulfobacillus filiaventi]